MEQVKLLEGEFYCPKCHGEYQRPSKGKWEVTSICGYCNGTGKVDWIENIVGKRKPEKRKLKGQWTISVEEDLKALHGIDVESELIDIVSVVIANGK